MTAKTLKKPSFLAPLLVGVGGLLVLGYAAIEARLEQPDIRNFLQTKVGEILKAKVKIGRLRYLPPAAVLLQDIAMEPLAEESSAFSIARMKKLVLGYGPLNLIRRDFYIPSTVRLDSPEIQFSSNRSPFPFLENSAAPSQGIPVQWVIEKGKFRYPWGGEALLLSKVRFKAHPDARGQIHVRLAAEAGGAAQGKIQVQGVMDAGFHHYRLDVNFEDVTFSPQSRVPLKKLSGRVQISEKSIQVAGLTSFLHDWEVHWKGAIDEWQTAPKVNLEVTRRKGKPPFLFLLQMDFGSGSLAGQWVWAGRKYPFQGKVVREGKQILFSELELPRQYAGRGVLDRSSGDYEFWFERERRRFHLHSNLSQEEWVTDFQLDHASIGRLDWVVSGSVRLRPLPKRAGESRPYFRGEVQTDYLIVEFKPLQDFRGTFELSSEAVEKMDFRWSGVFHLGGRILFRGPKSREDLMLRVGGFPLAAIRDIGGRPLPGNLSGTLEGKLKLRGESRRPEIQGYFTIKEGTLEKLDFDRAIIQFQGFPPYLKLYDSKIFKGRNVLKMTGAIDLTLQNLFHGIQIRGPDHLVLWKGMSFYWKEGQSAVQGEKPLGKKMAMGVELGAGVSESQGQDREETHAVFGPKLKF